MRRAAFLAFLLLLAPTAAPAFNVKALPAPAGEDVWFAEDHTLPMIAVTISLPAGSAYDPAGKAGLASFAAALLDEGAGPLDSRAFQLALAGKAIQLSATADKDYLDISLVTLSANAKDAFRLLALALAHPRFDADAVARVRVQALQGLQQDDEDPADVAAKGFDHIYFGAHPYGHPVDGDAGGIGAITQDDLRGFARSHWTRGGLKVAVAGDIDAATLSALVKSTFGPLSAASPAPPSPVTRVAGPGLTVIAMNVPQPSAVFGLPGILRSDPDFLAAYVANYILGGGGFASRLTNEVREKRGLTYDIDTDLDTLRRAGVVSGEVATKQGSMRQTIAVVRETLRKFAADGPTAQELADAKTYLTGSFPLAFSSNVGIAAQLGAFQQDGLPVDYVAKRNDLIGAVTLDDVRRAVRRLFNPARLVVVVAGSLGDAKPKPAQ